MAKKRRCKQCSNFFLPRRVNQKYCDAYCREEPKVWVISSSDLKDSWAPEDNRPQSKKGGSDGDME